MAVFFRTPLPEPCFGNQVAPPKSSPPGGLEDIGSKAQGVRFAFIASLTLALLAGGCTRGPAGAYTGNAVATITTGPSEEFDGSRSSGPAEVTLVRVTRGFEVHLHSSTLLALSDTEERLTLETGQVVSIQASGPGANLQLTAGQVQIQEDHIEVSLSASNDAMTLDYSFKGDRKH